MHTPPPSPARPLTLSRRAVESHKGDYGRVLLVGGSRGMAGSISLSATSALRSGSGLVTLAVPDRCLETAASFDPCVMTKPLADSGSGRFSSEAADQLTDFADAFDAFGIGPGMGTESGSAAVVQWFLASERPRAIDADALNVIARMDDWPERLRGPAVLTPHPGEWQRISGQSAKDRQAQRTAAVRIAAMTGTVILLKGAATFVTDGNQEYTNATGNPGMATGGSGDVLTGLITSLLGQGLRPFDAARLGAWIHGVAGDIAAERIGGIAGITATEIADALPAAIARATE